MRFTADTATAYCIKNKTYMNNGAIKAKKTPSIKIATDTQ